MGNSKSYQYSRSNTRINGEISMKCERCGKRVNAKDIKFSPLSEYAKHKRCGGKILKEQTFISGNQEVYI